MIIHWIEKNYKYKTRLKRKDLAILNNLFSL